MIPAAIGERHMETCSLLHKGSLNKTLQAKIGKFGDFPPSINSSYFSSSIANFDVTNDEEITLKGFIALHEMTAADEEGGEEEIWQVMKALGYNKQLQLSQASVWLFGELML